MKRQKLCHNTIGAPQAERAAAAGTPFGCSAAVEVKMYRTELIEEAVKARQHAYCPYSHFAVGAALLGKSGKIYRGCNVENASYGAGNCAERTAVFSAAAAGERKFVAIAVVGGAQGEEPPFHHFAFPCGVCRQVLWELGGPKLLVIVARGADDYREYRLDELLPEAFGPDAL